jgi:hypothetical protein
MLQIDRALGKSAAICNRAAFFRPIRSGFQRADTGLFKTEHVFHAAQIRS